MTDTSTLVERRPSGIENRMRWYGAHAHEEPLNLSIFQSDCIEAADHIRTLESEVQRLDYASIHACWDECPRLPCVQRRRIEALESEVERAFREGFNRGAARTHSMPPIHDEVTSAWNKSRARQALEDKP